jgi:hypothetical protein
VTTLNRVNFGVSAASRAGSITCALFFSEGRAKIHAGANGLVDVYADCVIGPGMGHLAHLFAWAIERGATASDESSDRRGGIEPAAALHLRITRTP